MSKFVFVILIILHRTNLGWFSYINPVKSPSFSYGLRSLHWCSTLFWYLKQIKQCVRPRFSALQVHWPHIGYWQVTGLFAALRQHQAMTVTTSAHCVPSSAHIQQYCCCNEQHDFNNKYMQDSIMNIIVSVDTFTNLAVGSSSGCELLAIAQLAVGWDNVKM